MKKGLLSPPMILVTNDEFQVGNQVLIFKFFFGGILHLYERIFSLSGKSFDLNVNLFPVTSVSYFDSYNPVPRSHSV